MRFWPLLLVRQTIPSSRRNRSCSFWSTRSFRHRWQRRCVKPAVEAVYVIDLGLLAATDQQIWDAAISQSAVLVTKDRDFPLRRAATNDGPAILWSELAIPAIES